MYCTADFDCFISADTYFSVSVAWRHAFSRTQIHMVNVYNLGIRILVGIHNIYVTGRDCQGHSSGWRVCAYR